MKNKYHIYFTIISLFLAVTWLAFSQVFSGVVPAIAPQYAEAGDCNVPAVGTVFYSDSSTYALSGYSIPAARYCGYNTTDGNWCTPDDYPGITSSQTQTLQVGGGDGYRYSGAVNDGRTSMQCSWDFKVTNVRPNPCSISSSGTVYTDPTTNVYTDPGYSLPAGTYYICYPGGCVNNTYAYPGYSQGPTNIGPGIYTGSGPGCSWSVNVVSPPPILTWYGTPNGSTIPRSEDYKLDVRANMAVQTLDEGTNIWPDSGPLIKYVGTRSVGSPGDAGQFDCSTHDCVGKMQWSPTARKWGGGGLDGTYFTNAPAGHWDATIRMQGTNGVWSGPLDYYFDLVPPTYTHYTVGSWGSCSGYNTETGLGGTQTRTVTSYTNTTSPNDSAPASSQSCSVPTYTHYNVSAWTACAGYNLNTGQNGTQTRTVSSYVNTTSPNDPQPSSSQSCSMPADFNFLSAPGSGTLGNTYSTFVTFVGGQQSALSAPVSIAVNPTFPDYPNPPSLAFSVTNVSPPLPAGVSYTFTPNPLSSGQYSQGASFVANVPVTDSGLYTLTIEASGGGIVKQATVFLNVNTVNPSFIEI